MIIITDAYRGAEASRQQRHQESTVSQRITSPGDLHTWHCKPLRYIYRAKLIMETHHQ